ncbi:hypothetical protein FRC01_011760 [Tulasnella sp. 417]|nr:hypothetical protein FRC01_011760 [Tulasnella sp. 417]
MVFSRYRRWKTTVDEKVHNLELKSVLNDPGVLLDCIDYVHDDTSRRLYFVADFDFSYTDRKQVTKLLPRATLPATGEIALPTREGMFGVFEEASKNGGSVLVHCGMHGMCEPSGRSVITEDDDGTIHFMNIPDGSASEEAFMVDANGERIYGEEFLRHLSDSSGRTGMTLTLSLDMCNAAAFLDGVVGLPYQYGEPDFAADHSEPVGASRSNNQLVVISASKRGEFAGEFGRCGAMTYFLKAALRRPQQGTAANVIQYMREKCKGRQTPQIASRYPSTGRFRLLPDIRSRL